MSEAEWLRVRDEWRKHLRDIADTLPLKQLAADLGVPSSSLSHAFGGRTSHVLKAEWVPYLIARALTDDALKMLARLRGKLLIDAPDHIPPEEEIRNIKASLARHLSPELRQLILNESRAR
jgi:hypothetical protein